MKTAGGPVLFLVSHSSAGGAQEIWANLAEGFLSRGYDVRLMALYPLRSTVRTTSAELPWIYLTDRQPRSLGEGLRLLRSVASLVRRHQPRAIFTAMPAANVAAALGARMAGNVARVITSHHSPVDTHGKLLNAIDGLSGSLRSVKAIVSVSEAVARSLSGKPAPYRRKGRVITNALPPRIEERLAELAKVYAPRTVRGRKIVATGRLAPQKNYPHLIRAVGLLKDVTLDIVGNGPDEEALRTLARNVGAADRIRFLGHRPREEALAILAEGDVFAQVSLFEGHSLGLIEAAKLGIPLVVSQVPVQIEGITARDGSRCGLTVAVDDDQGLVGQLRGLLDEPEEYAYWVRRAGQLGAEATYSDMVDAYEALVS
jgi:glycosyltransferase involved in cell wall biosynthesis